MFKWYKKLDDGTMLGEPVVAYFNPYGLIPLDRKKALEAVNLIKEKFCGNTKGRTCANGSKQRKDLKPDESVYSPTCPIKALMETLVIDVMEQIYVAILGVPEDFLQHALPVDRFLLIKIIDEFVEGMCDFNPEYIPYVRYENGKKVLNVNILRAIYGCIDSALLWYRLYSETLGGM